MKSFFISLKVTLSLVFLFGLTLKLEAQIDVKRLNPFERINFSLKAKNSQDKASILKNLDMAKDVPVYNTWNNSQEFNNDVLLVCKEKGEFAFDIKNKSDKLTQISIQINLPEQWEIKIRRQAFLTDFYTHQRKSNLNISFYGDPLPLLSQSENSNWSLSLEPGEVGRIFVEFYTKDELAKSDISIIFTPKLEGVAGASIKKSISLEVMDKVLPDVSFPSIVYNNNSYQIASYTNELIKNQFSHLLVKETPTLNFDKDGNIAGSGDANSTSSQAFRYVTNMWVKENQPIILYLEGNYEKLAPLYDKSGYLAPFSDPWMKAYLATVNAVFQNIKNRFPNFSEKDMLLYVYDEISSGKLDASPSPKVKDIGRLLKYIKQNAPQYKTFLTLGIYTYPNDIKEVLKNCDILSPHIIMPSELTRNAPKTYNPAKAFKANLFDQLDKQRNLNILKIKALSRVSSNYNATYTTPSQWSYLVTQGRTANILDFRALPLHALVLGREGMSWWAFSDTKGSSWFPNDMNDLDYSLVYNRESNNAVYKYWNQRNEGIFIPSIRLFAASAGIEDAKLLKYLIINFSSLNSANQQKLSLIVINQLLKSIDRNTSQPDREKYLSLKEYDDLAKSLREIYSTL